MTYAWLRSSIVLLFAALVGCGPATNAPSPSSQGQSAAASPSAGLVAPRTPDTAILPLMIDPAQDTRPDSEKSDDFTGHLQRIQANMAAVDADFLTRVRAAMEAGSQADAKRLIADYRNLIAADIAALPGPPRLTGCFAAAAPLNAKAEAAVAAMLADRRDKADKVAMVSDRPLTLADFGGLATDFASGSSGGDAQSSVTAARDVASGCQAAVAQHARPPASPPQPPPHRPAAQPTAQPTAPPAAPVKKTGLFQRLFGN